MSRLNLLAKSTDSFDGLSINLRFMVKLQNPSSKLFSLLFFYINFEHFLKFIDMHYESECFTIYKKKKKLLKLHKRLIHPIYEHTYSTAKWNYAQSIRHEAFFGSNGNLLKNVVALAK